MACCCEQSQSVGDAISSLLFQPPEPTKLKEDKIIWLETSRGKSIPSFHIELSQGKQNKFRFASSTDASSGRSLKVVSYNNVKRRDHLTILYSHANAEDLGDIYPWCKFLAKTLGVNIFAYDYTGYGLASNQGPPSEENCIADIEAAFNYLTKKKQIDPRNIVLYGRSLGSGPSCYLAAAQCDEGRDDSKATQPLGGVILHAPFLSVFRVVLESGCTLYGDKFPNVDLMPFIKSPILLIHGTGDKIVPFHHSEQLQKAIDPQYRTTPLFIEGMGHNNVHAMVRPLFVDHIGAYLDSAVIQPSPAPLVRRRFLPPPSKTPYTDTEESDFSQPEAGLTPPLSPVSTDSSSSDSEQSTGRTRRMKHEVEARQLQLEKARTISIACTFE